ncbi:MAG: hypothetical protein Fur0042_26570 [Cyanophyceae cyanobacterium]
MVVDAEIREQAYAYFVTESQDLLRSIEDELFLLREAPEPARIHALMRATHTLKGASANVGLENIKIISHHMEDVFRTLFDPEAAVDIELESLLFQLYECLRTSLMSELENNHDRDRELLDTAVDIFAKIQTKLGDCFGRETALPTSAELGFDLVKSIFESGVQERLENLEALLTAGDGDAIAADLATQSEIFVGLAESLGLTGFGEISQAVARAIAVPNADPLVVGQAAFDNWKAAQAAVFDGDRQCGGTLSDTLAALAGMASAAPPSGLPDGELTFSDDWGSGDDDILDLSLDGEEVMDLGEMMTPPPAIAPAPAAAMATATTVISPEAPPPAPNRPSLAPPPSSIRVELDRLQELQHLVGELLIGQNRQSLQDEQLQQALGNFRSGLRQHKRVLAQLRDRLEQLDRQAIATGTASKTAAIAQNGSSPSHRLLGHSSYGSLRSPLVRPRDAQRPLPELVQLALGEAEQLERTLEAVERYTQQTRQVADNQRRLLGSARDSLMEARMQPVSAVFSRFPPLMHQLSSRYGKPVELRIVGDRVNIDKVAIEQLYDPLLHLVRNAFDHGIEDPDHREAAGKPREGIVQLQALQQGNQVLIIVSDDGGGIDPAKIRTKASERNLMPDARLATLTDNELFDLLFEPGFSTAAQVTDLSGRGVGLDVVKSQMRALKGTVNVQSVLGRGTAFILRIPLSLMTARLLICNADRAVYALLSDSISQILIPQPEQTKILGGQRVLRWQQGDAPEVTLPVRKLSDLVNYRSLQPGKLLPEGPSMKPILSNRLAPLLLLQGEGGLVAIEVDGVVGEQELVLRQLSELIPAPPYLYGCTILGDGRMVLVLDGTALLESSDVAQVALPMPTAPPAAIATLDPSEAAPPELPEALPEVAPTAIAHPPTAIAPEPRDRPPCLLVVEDSETERQILTLTLEKAGYRVIQAANGVEALDQLQNAPDVRLIVSDLEMPRMNGLEFLSTRRQNPKIANIPVLMLTSCSGQQYYQVVMGLGAAGYMTKPHIRQELLDTIAALLP